MYLKSLTLLGFKSFADKTHFEFHTGVTGIVGPNGCGKSNVVDAIRWVLGETSAKALRGEEMADVIFNGTDKRKPVGLAEVTLTMADCEQSLGVDYNEVAITRRVFRDGRSEYRMNNTLCRLKDIHELFAGTGVGRAAYSIMAQGQIDMLLSSKPEDRRSVFEEAAGITKFKGQKREALRKLEYTEANLLRVADIVAEVKRQMGSLQRQAAKARRYQTLLKDARTLDTHLGHKHWTELVAEKSETENQIRSLMMRLNEAHKELHHAEQDSAQTKEAYHALENTIAVLRNQSQELRAQIQSAEGRIGFNRERSDELEARIERNVEDSETTRNLLEQQQQDMASTDEQVTAIQANMLSRQEALNAHNSAHLNLMPQRQNLEQQRRAARETMRQAESRIASAEARIQSLQTSISSSRQRFELLQKDRQTTAQVRETAQVEFDELQRQSHEIEATRNELDEKLKECSRTMEEKRRLRDVLESELNDHQRNVTLKRSRLEVLTQLLQQGDGLAQGTQQVLKGLDNPGVYGTGVRGILASSIEVEADFIAAVEAALREHLQAVLMTDSDLATQVIERLGNQRLGKAALVSQDLIELRPTGDRQFLPQGALAWAADKVRAKEGAASVIDHLLGNVAISPDLQTALRIKKERPDLAVVTLQGEFISTAGVIFGGASQDDESSTLRREAELRSLKSEVEALEVTLREREEQVLDLRIQLEDLQREESQVREQSLRAREGLSQLQGKLSVVQRDLQQAVAKAEAVEWELAQMTERIDEAEQQIVALRDEAASANDALEAGRAREYELEVEAEGMSQREAESAERLSELRTALALEQGALQAVERQKAPMIARLNELQGTIHRFEHEIMTWRERIAQSQAENQRLAEEVESNRIRMAEAEDELRQKGEDRAALQEKVTQIEQQLTALRNENAHMNETRGKAEVTLTRVDLRLENLVSQMQERYQLNFETFEPDPHALLLAIDDQKKARGRSEKRKATLAAKDDGEGATEVPEGAEVASEEAADEVVEIPGEALEGEPDWDFVAEVVTELRQRLESIGPVNLDAIQEFEELEERHNFLDGQYADLTKSKDELLQVIAKINDTTKAMFSDTFAQVKHHFQHNFRELFGAQAKADLMLIDEGDPLESGIEIIAKPPGKKLQTISLLSGGERSMTAVALLFSIYMVKPSPFCVLDELDAPLDESNISRFLKMLDKFINNSQFIIVTHNKRTMSRADVIYGVTMQEFGVSKPVGVRMTAEATSIERQRGIGKVEVDLPEEAAAQPEPPPEEVIDEFASLNVDSEQAKAAEEAPEPDDYQHEAFVPEDIVIPEVVEVKSFEKREVPPPSEEDQDEGELVYIAAEDETDEEDPSGRN
ncbi:MAG: chromosome segregation protein SMC [Verrucomicrobiaceae bacterium]|nr:chromosome segregation protein SMC [Verrucomicrobiaceae bacterium]